MAPAESARTRTFDALDVLGRDLLKRQVQHRLMVGGGVRAGVARPQQAAQRLARLIGIASL